MDAVVSALGPVENKPVFTIAEGTQHILDAMHQHAVQRLVVYAGAGIEPAEVEHGVKDGDRLDMALPLSTRLQVHLSVNEEIR